MSNSLPWWDPQLAVVDEPTRMADYRRLQFRWRGVFLDLPPGSYKNKHGQQRPLGSRLPNTSQPRHQMLSDEAVEHTQKRLPELEAESRKAEPDRLWFTSRMSCWRT